ncbi:hypothetical protein [Prochlorococcus sp. MIT 1223]|uniref:hypothetical protein n=1 Tax=Prochlorococcus sp. MIT 1223 TaxID=3096217 RepID=UPI002A762877|nr:hypothetical protein [Prochlorococcus sp. MIT 1223]
MKLEIIDISLAKPKGLSISDLRGFILENLKEYGDPLRWAITQSSETHLKVEAIIIIQTT